MRLTYNLLKELSYKQLIKKGFTEKQIFNKLSNFYLKEQRQLIINERKGQTVESALKLLKKGKVSQSTWIHKTALNTFKNDLRFMKKVGDILGEDSFAVKLLKEAQRGEMNPYQFNSAVQRYTDNQAQYECNDIVNNEDIKLLIEGYSY